MRMYIFCGLDSHFLFIYFLSCYFPFKAKGEEGAGAYPSCTYVKAGDSPEWVASSPLGEHLETLL